VTKTATERVKGPARGPAERWARRVERLKRSGLSIWVFAAREGLAAGSLSHWKWKLERQGRGTSRKTQVVEIKTFESGLMAVITRIEPVAGSRSGETSLPYPMS
jgi:hypothetical protein